jgi:membrane protein
VDAAASQVSPAVGEQIAALLAKVRDHAGTGGPLGFALLLFVVLAIFVQFERAFDVIWGAPKADSKGIIASLKRIVFIRFKAFMMLVGVWGLVMASLFVNLSWTGYEEYAAAALPHLSPAGWWLQQLASLAINVIAFALVYRLVPKACVLWRHALAGGLLAGVLWEVGRLVLAMFVIGQRYESAYGVIGSFMAVMLWCYYGAAVMFLGAEYTQALGAECDSTKATAQ